MDKRPRFSQVPWLADAADLRAMGEPETTVELGTSIEHGLCIPHPFGPGTDAVLLITATRGNGNDGGVIALSIAGERRKAYRQEPLPTQSGRPRRMWMTDEDIQREIDDAD